MGWYYPYSATTKKDAIREVLREFTWENEKTGAFCKPLRKCLRGNMMWVLVETSEVRMIACALLGTDRDGVWGYKPMDESMGPFYFSCPLGYLDEATEPVNETAREWREAVRERHAERRS